MFHKKCFEGFKRETGELLLPSGFQRIGYRRAVVIEFAGVQVDALLRIEVAGQIPGNGVIQDGHPLLEESRVPQRREHPAQIQQRLCIQQMDRTIIKIGVDGKVSPATAWTTEGIMLITAPPLFQRVDSAQHLGSLGPLPVFHQFGPMRPALGNHAF